SSSSIDVDVTATTANIDIATNPSCQWSAFRPPEDFFLTITDAFGSNPRTGPGSVTVSIAANNQPPGFLNPPRTGRVQIALEPFVVNQAGCAFSVTPLAATFGASGGNGSARIGAPPLCPWDVSGLPAWASTLSGGSGSGDGVWTYLVAPAPP